LVTDVVRLVSSVRPLLLAQLAPDVTFPKLQQTLVRSRTCRGGHCLRLQGPRPQSKNSTSTRLTIHDQDLAPSPTARTKLHRRLTLELPTVTAQKSWVCSPINAEDSRVLESKFPSGERTPAVA